MQGRFDTERLILEFDITNEELANAANITLYTASRILSAWQRTALFAFPGILVLKPSAPAALRSPRQQQALSFPALFGAASHMQLTACVFDHTLLGPLAT